ncbi:MAG: hypothetical protein GOV15_04160, partial [Candidatus Diapherotrites archaeon]|nr:hypothetical protein [Candidatus Diapherotrites archaeon]
MAAKKFKHRESYYRKTLSEELERSMPFLESCPAKLAATRTWKKRPSVKQLRKTLEEDLASGRKVVEHVPAKGFVNRLRKKTEQKHHFV